MLQRLTSARDAVQVLRTATRRRLDDGAWHVWTVTLPRRSITGRLVWGTVWRRRDQGRWLYKRYVEPRRQADIGTSRVGRDIRESEVSQDISR